MLKTILKKVILVAIIFSSLGCIVLATGEEYTPNEDNDILIDNWDNLPFKNQKMDNSDWLTEVNSLCCEYCWC